MFFSLIIHFITIRCRCVISCAYAYFRVRIKVSRCQSSLMER